MSSIDQSRSILNQGIRLLETLSAAVYRAPLAGGGSGMGPHLRHCIEFYQCFLAGLPEGRVDYDGRPRDQDLETDPLTALAALRSIETALAEVAEIPMDRLLRVRSDAEGEAAEDWCPSSVGRELAFLLSHTVHHYALIQLVLREQGVHVEPGFGLAPSTERHRREVETTGKSNVCAP